MQQRPHGTRNVPLSILATVIPGLLPLAQRRLKTGVLFLIGATWLRLMLASHAAPPQRLETFFVGPFGMTGGIIQPISVFVTGLVLFVHVLAWRDARPRS